MTRASVVVTLDSLARAACCRSTRAADEFSNFAKGFAASPSSCARLSAWRDVVNKLDDKGKFDVAIEFVEPLATIALNLPYVIRSRFIFATAHLSHQAGMAAMEKSAKS